MSLHKPGQGRNQGTQFVPFPSLVSGDKDVASAATPEALSSTTEISFVEVTAKSGNAGSVFVGSSTSQDKELEALDAVGIAINDLAKVFVRVASDGDGVTFLYVI